MSMASLWVLLFGFARSAALSVHLAEADEGRTASLISTIGRSLPHAGVPELPENGTFKVKLHRRPVRTGHGSQLRGARAQRRSFMQIAAKATASFSQTVEIFGTIYVGTPATEFSVTFDTASGNLLLPSSKCTGVACLSHAAYDEALSGTAKPIFMLDEPVDAPAPPGGQRETVKLNIGRGSATGELSADQVCLDSQLSVCSKSAFVTALEMTDEPFLLFPYDGIMGLGMPALSLQKRFNMLGNLADVGVLKRSLFAIWLADASDGEDSEITFGSIDDQRLGSTLMWLPISNVATGMWQVTMKDLLIGNVSLGVCPRGKDACQVAFDTGTSAITGPTSLMKGLEAEVKVNEDCTNYDKLPTLGFDFGEYVLWLENKDYVRRTSGTSCHHEFYGLDMPPPKGPIILLGEPFLKRYYTIYDRSTMRVGIGLAKHKTPSAVQDETTEEAAARLMVARTHPEEN